MCIRFRALQGVAWILNAMVSGKDGSGGDTEGPEDIPEKDVWVSVTMFILLLSRHGICAHRNESVRWRMGADWGIVDGEKRVVVTSLV
jgi:hypothetical protein